MPLDWLYADACWSLSVVRWVPGWSTKDLTRAYEELRERVIREARVRRARLDRSTANPAPDWGLREPRRRRAAQAVYDWDYDLSHYNLDDLAEERRGDRVPLLQSNEQGWQSEVEEEIHRRWPRRLDRALPRPVMTYRLGPFTGACDRRQWRKHGASPNGYMACYYAAWSRNRTLHGRLRVKWRLRCTLIPSHIRDFERWLFDGLEVMEDTLHSPEVVEALGRYLDHIIPLDMKPQCESLPRSPGGPLPSCTAILTLVYRNLPPLEPIGP